MKKTIITILFVLFFVYQAQAQVPDIYLPVIFKMPIITPDVENNWRIIQPLATINRMENPSAEKTGNFSAVGGATVDRSTTFQKYGLRSFRVQTAGDNEGISIDIQGNLGNAFHWATVRVRGTLPDSWDWSLDNSIYRTPRLIEKIDKNWNLYGLSFPAAQANNATLFYIRQNGAGSGDFFLDGVQVEENTTWTTYCDGTQEGCFWKGIPHEVDSERSGQSRAGGVSYDFWEQYKFQVQKIVGAGASSHSLGVDSFAILPGGELNSDKTVSRDFNIIGKFITTDEEELHEMRQALEAAFQTDDRQLTRIRFNGAEVQKEIAVRYKGGLEGDLAAFYGNIEIVEDDQFNEVFLFTEKVSIQVTAPDPFWLEVGESAISLDTNDSATFRVVATRFRSTGQWDELGPPNAAGTYVTAQAFAEDDTYVYVGGGFTNFDNIAAADFLVRWHKRNETWSAVGAPAFDNTVQTLALGPDGILYVGGLFTTAGGAPGNFIAQWNGAAWSSLGTGMSGGATTVEEIVIGLDGTLYATGAFTTAGGVAAANIAQWDGSAWSALGAGLVGGRGDALTVGLDGRIYVGGGFTTAGGGAAATIAVWDPSATTWSALGSGTNGVLGVLALTTGGDGRIYLGGDFTTAGGNSASRIAVWNGTDFSNLSSGVNSTVEKLAIGPDDIVYASGQFTTAGGIILADNIARWNQFAWAHLDIDLPGSAIAHAIMPSQFVDPVVPQNYDLWIGFDTTGTGTFAGLVEVDNDGSVQAFPKIVFARDGGTSAVIETLRNETTGNELLFDYSLLDGETLIIDLEPTAKSIISSFFGSRLDAVLPNSDFGIWSLPRGDSDVTSYVNVAGGPTMVTYMQWRDAYSGYD